MMRSAFSAIVLSLALVLPAYAAPSEESVAFAKDFAQMNGAMLRASQIAANESKDARVKEFASRIAADSLRADKAFAEACKSAGMQVPARSVTAASLPDASGNTLDRVYTLEISQQLAQARALFTNASESAKVEEPLRQFARAQLKSVQGASKSADALARNEAGVSSSGKE